MKIETLSVESIITNRDGMHNYFAWPSVARLRDGRLAAVASGFRVWHKCPFGKDVISFSADEGKTWSIPAITFDTPMDDRDSGIVAFGESGVLVTSCNNGSQNPLYLHGADKVVTVGNYTRAYLDYIEERFDSAEIDRKYAGSLFRVSYDNGATFGPIMKMPVTSPHGPALLPDDTFLWVGNVIHWNETNMRQEIKAYHLWPDGHFEELGSIEPVEGLFYAEPHALVLSDGTILVHIRMEQPSDDESLFSVYQSESFDGGRTFTKPHSIGSENAGGAPPHLIADGDTLISVYAHRNHPHQIRAAFSRNQGKTWDCDNVLCDLPDLHADLGYPASVALKDGSILTVFYGADEGSPHRIFWTGQDCPIYEFVTPVIRQVVWRYSKE